MIHVVLTGFMAAGKTAVGKRLARRLGRDFIDTDDIIEKREGDSIEGIFKARGEAAFRTCERAAIAGLDPSRPSVIATGGGSFVDEDNRRCLRGLGVVVCLVSSIETIIERTSRARTVRPLASDPERLVELLAERMPFYRKADILVETDGLSVEQAASRVIAMVAPHLRLDPRGGGNAPSKEQ